MRRSSIVAVLASAISLLAPLGADASSENVVFASNRDGTYDIWRMNPDGTGQAKVGGSSTADDFAPAVSPDGNKIAFVRGSTGSREGEIWVMSIFGTNQTKLASFASDPAWSPNGQQIAFGVPGNGERPNGIWKMNADGTGQTKIVEVDRDHMGPSWSPDGQKIAFHTALSYSDENVIWSVNADGTNPIQLTAGSDTAGDTDPDWSPDGSSIAFSRAPWCTGCREAIFKMNAGGSGETRVTDNDPSLLSDFRPAWSSDQTRIAFLRQTCCSASDDEIWTMNPDGTGQTRLTTNTASDIDPDWGLLRGTGYPRPKGGTPLRSSLVVAYEPCATPNRQHAPPLAGGSCNPPAQTSNYLTVGTLDANGAAARSVGSVRFDVYDCSPCANPLPEDVRLNAATTDVRNQGDLSDYAGELQAAATLQITDRYNGPGLNEAATTQPVDFRFSVPCTTNGDPAIGSTCSISTSVQSLMPGAFQQQGRTNWEVGQVRLYDGGADKTGSTTADNTLFEIQGVFVP